jgi:hypothetical protein
MTLSTHRVDDTHKRAGFTTTNNSSPYEKLEEPALSDDILEGLLLLLLHRLLLHILLLHPLIRKEA